MVYVLLSIYFDSPQLGIQYKLHKTLHYWSGDMLNFDFLEKDLEVVSRPHFMYDFSRKMFLMLHSINWPNFIFWLPLLFKVLGNMCVAIVCFPGCDVINFEINLIFLIKLLRQKFKYLENEKNFYGEIKKHFSSFLKAFSFQKLSQTWEYAFKLKIKNDYSFGRLSVNKGVFISYIIISISPFLTNIPILYHPSKLGNQTFSGVFKW